MEEHWFLGKSIVSNYMVYSKKYNLIQYRSVDYLDQAIRKCNKDEILKEIDMLYIPVMQERNFMRFSTITDHMLTILQSYDKKVMDYNKGELFNLVEPGDEANWFTTLDIVYWIKTKFISIIRLNMQQESVPYVNRLLVYMPEDPVDFKGVV